MKIESENMSDCKNKIKELDIETLKAIDEYVSKTINKSEKYIERLKEKKEKIQKEIYEKTNNNTELGAFLNRIDIIKYRYRNNLAILNNLSFTMKRQIEEIENLSNDFRNYMKEIRDD